MQKLAITTALALIALALGTTTTTTTMQIQPAYSQPSHCFDSVVEGFLRCVKPGKDASDFGCDPLRGCSGGPIDPDVAGQGIGQCHVASAKGFGECTVTKTPPSLPDGPE
jgi:hypothetical protein